MNEFFNKRAVRTLRITNKSIKMSFLRYHKSLTLNELCVMFRDRQNLYNKFLIEFDPVTFHRVRVHNENCLLKVKSSN